MGGKIPWADWAQIFSGRRYPRRNHVFQIWWRSVEGFSVGWGSNFATSHRLWRSSLQHSHTTVWACDFCLLPSVLRWPYRISEYALQAFRQNQLCVIATGVSQAQRVRSFTTRNIIITSLGNTSRLLPTPKSRNAAAVSAISHYRCRGVRHNPDRGRPGEIAGTIVVSGVTSTPQASRPRLIDGAQ